MNGFLIRVLISSVLLLGHSVTASENNAMSLIKHLPSALRTALGRAETDIESMIEKLHRHLPKDRKEALLKIVIEITGETPEWYRKELEGKK